MEVCRGSEEDCRGSLSLRRLEWSAAEAAGGRDGGEEGGESCY